MRDLLTNGTPTIFASLAIIAGLAGCAGATSTGSTVTGSTLKIYAGQPPRGAGGQATQDTLDGERLALAQVHGQVGHFKVVLKSLSGAKISDDARTAIADSSSIAYLGELAPHSSGDSLGITNGVGLLQVSPADTAIELTQPTKAVPNSPTRYYESIKTYGRTFGRVVPAANHEAGVQVQMMQKLGVRKLYVADDGGPYGSAVALAVANAAGSKGIAVTRGPGDPTKISSSGADALFLGASDQVAAARLFNAVAATSARIKIFGPSALSEDTFVATLIPAAQRALELSEPGFMETGPHANLTAAARGFIAQFKTAYGRDPGQSAFFGYEAMSRVLEIVQGLAGSGGSTAINRSDVVKAFFGTKQRPSVLGTYSIDVNGDTSLAPYIFSHIKAGKLVPFAAMQG